VSRRTPTPTRKTAARARRGLPPKVKARVGGKGNPAPSLSGPQAWKRDPEGQGLLPTFLQFPTRPLNERAMADREDAILATYNGRLRELVDLGRTLIGEDGFQAGLLDTMSHGLIGMPLSFQGDPGMIVALTDSAGTPGEWGKLHPENEAAKILADGIVFNLGLGQYVFDEADIVRPIGAHRVPRIVWRDPRWLRRDPYTLQWYFLGRGGEVPITPGDGEWVLFQPYPDTDAWRHGPILYMTLCAIFSRDTLFDRQRVSEVCAPTRVARAVKPTDRKVRAKMAADVAKMAHDNQITLSHEWLYEIVTAAAGDYWKVCDAIITWARQMVEVGLTGNILSIEGPTGFSNADIYRRVTDSRRRFYANAWTRALREQGLTWWVRDNYGEAAVQFTPVPVYNVESPEDAIARAGALKAWGEGIKACAEGIGAAGVELDVEYVIETLQRAGIRAKVKAGPVQVASLNLGVEQVAAVVRGNIAAQNLGIAPFPPGDPRGDMTLVEIANMATGAAASAPKPPAPGPEAAPPPTGAAPEEEEPAEEDDGGAAARLADDMNAHAQPHCRHRKTSLCRTCGIRASYRIVPGENGAPNRFHPTWSPIKAAPAKVAA
jgi:hypothetical protein